MKFSIFKARINRNGFVENAGKFFQDENSNLIKELINKDNRALVGIQREDGVYTVLGENALYYKTTSGIEGAVTFKEFLTSMSKIATKRGKRVGYDFIKLKNGNEVWVLSEDCMFSMWNSIFYLYPDHRYLESDE